MNDNDDTTAPGELDLQTLRDGFAALACEPVPETAPVGEHPEPGTIYAAVHGELPPGELRDVVEHIGTCPQCAEEWRLARVIGKEAEEAEDESPRRAAAPYRPALRLVPIAATLVIAMLAAGVWLTVGQSPDQTAPVYRDAVGATGIVSLLPEGEALDRENPVLRWRLGEEGAPEGTTYDLLVSTVPAEGFETVAEVTDLSTSSYTLPPEALEGLAPGTELQWIVDARLPDGKPARSGVFVTRVP